MKTLFLHLLLLLIYPGKRALYIFYNQSGVAIKNQQLTELGKDSSGITERDIVIQTYPVNTATNEVKKYRVDGAKPFTIILIGKDGGEKLRSDTFLSITKLFATIDAMPMRKAEMKNEE